MRAPLYAFISEYLMYFSHSISHLAQSFMIHALYPNSYSVPSNRIIEYRERGGREREGGREGGEREREGEGIMREVT
jgi:hypothetical protein